MFLISLSTGMQIHDLSGSLWEFLSKVSITITLESFSSVAFLTHRNVFQEVHDVGKTGGESGVYDHFANTGSNEKDTELFGVSRNYLSCYQIGSGHSTVCFLLVVLDFIFLVHSSNPSKSLLKQVGGNKLSMSIVMMRL